MSFKKGDKVTFSREGKRFLRLTIEKGKREGVVAYIPKSQIKIGVRWNGTMEKSVVYYHGSFLELLKGDVK